MLLRFSPLFSVDPGALISYVPETAYALTPPPLSLQVAGDVLVPATAYTATAPVPAMSLTSLIPRTAYVQTPRNPSLTGLSLTVLTDNTLEATGNGDFTISITQPLAYQGTYTADASNEGAAANLNFTALLTAPQGLLAPEIFRSIDADGSGTSTAGDTFVATQGLWVFDSDDAGTVVQSGQWHLDGTPISGALSLTRLQPVAGSLTYVGSLTGAGTTRTMTSNAIVLPAVDSTVIVPLTDYALTAPVVTTSGFWDITAGDASATINTFPAVPTSPAWAITAGDASATVTSYPGQI